MKTIIAKSKSGNRTKILLQYEGGKRCVSDFARFFCNEGYANISLMKDGRMRIAWKGKIYYVDPGDYVELVETAAGNGNEYELIQLDPTPIERLFYTGNVIRLSTMEEFRVLKGQEKSGWV